jgi:hypothetical protein
MSEACVKIMCCINMCLSILILLFCYTMYFLFFKYIGISRVDLHFLSKGKNLNHYYIHD